ncbi:MAG: hypothetical protein ACXVPN_03855 [Bacteroidia bacterium]
MERTFRELFTNNASAKKNKATFYYVSIVDSTVRIDVSDVIKPLGDMNPSVKSDVEFHSLSQEEKDNIKYLRFYISGIKFTANSKKAVVNCGYYESSLSSSGNIVTLVKKRGKWKVLKNEMIWIS